MPHQSVSPFDWKLPLIQRLPAFAPATSASQIPEPLCSNRSNTPQF